jgi:hypothetical protein
MEQPRLIDVGWDGPPLVTHLVDPTRCVTPASASGGPRRRGPGVVQVHTCTVCREPFEARRFAAFCSAKCRKVWSRRLAKARRSDPSMC